MRRYLLSLIAVGLWPTLTFAQTGTQVVEYYHTDALGSVRAVTKVVNGQTQMVSRHDYKPFGEEVAPQTPPVDKRLFTGKERDAETGLDYFGARYLASGVGRFTSVDPLMSTGKPADPQSWNRYSYTRSNPLRFVDPEGLFTYAPFTPPELKNAFKDYLRKLRMMADDKDVDPVTRKELAQALGNYGGEGEDNGVVVGFGATSAGAYGEAAPGLGGRTYVTFNFWKLEGRLAAAGWTGKTVELAKMAAITHEGVHIPDCTWRNSLKLTWDDWFNHSSFALTLERRAFEAQSRVWMAANEKDPFGLWNPAWARQDAQQLRLRGVDQAAAADIKFRRKLP
jgi:RHS repeat-associated protein